MKNWVELLAQGKTDEAKEVFHESLVAKTRDFLSAKILKESEEITEFDGEEAEDSMEDLVDEVHAELAMSESEELDEDSGDEGEWISLEEEALVEDEDEEEAEGEWISLEEEFSEAVEDEDCDEVISGDEDFAYDEVESDELSVEDDDMDEEVADEESVDDQIARLKAEMEQMNESLSTLKKVSPKAAEPASAKRPLNKLTKMSLPKRELSTLTNSKEKFEPSVKKSDEGKDMNTGNAMPKPKLKK